MISNNASIRKPNMVGFFYDQSPQAWILAYVHQPKTDGKLNRSYLILIMRSVSSSRSTHVSHINNISTFEFPPVHIGLTNKSKKRILVSLIYQPKAISENHYGRV